MRDDLQREVLARLQRDYDGLKPRTNTDYMRGGKCPSCGKKELYVYVPKPWTLK